MTIQEAVKNFPRQFAYKPHIENRAAFKKRKKFIVAGMGGSHLAADLLKTWKPELNLVIHKDYGLPAMSDAALKTHTVILSSYSGNTEEVRDALERAREKQMSMICVSAGGQLREAAKTHGIPSIELPDAGIEPRMALGYSLKALLAVVGDGAARKDATAVAKLVRADALEDQGKALGQSLKGYVPVIYASRRNKGLAYNWKIKFNETAKIPAFSNVFPELNHNEMTGFDRKEGTRDLSRLFRFVFLEDDADDPRIKKRMALTRALYEDRGFEVRSVSMTGGNVFAKIATALLVGDWAALALAGAYGVNPDGVPMVEEFKARMASRE